MWIEYLSPGGPASGVFLRTNTNKALSQSSRIVRAALVARCVSATPSPVKMGLVVMFLIGGVALAQRVHLRRVRRAAGLSTGGSTAGFRMCRLRAAAFGDRRDGR